MVEIFTSLKSSRACGECTSLQLNSVLSTKSLRPLGGARLLDECRPAAMGAIMKRWLVFLLLGAMILVGLTVVLPAALLYFGSSESSAPTGPVAF
jgi:hypothetical protein